MDKTKYIEQLGLSKQETAAYLSLLKLGGAQASQVAKDMGVKRTTVYAILATLKEKGFATVYFKKSKRYYYAQKPARVAQLFEKKITAFEQIIPLLTALETRETERVGLQFIETKEELKNFYREILEEYKNKEYRIISSAQGWEEVDPEFFIKFRQDRARAKIKTRLLLSAKSKEINPTDPKLLRAWKYLPEKFSFKSTIDIFDDKVLIVTPSMNSLAVVIAVPAMVDVFASMFEVVWEVV